MPQVCLQFVIVEFPDHTHLLFLTDQVRFNNFVEGHIGSILVKFSFKMALWYRISKFKYMHIQCGVDITETRITQCTVYIHI